ncbi:MAG: glycoside hydrolase family 2 TIM barrel-domain containing protein, partial [Alistipes sp.]
HLTSRATGDNCTVSVELTTPDGYQAFVRSVRARLDGKPVMVPFELEKPMLWSPATPALYTLTACIEHGGARDTVRLHTGFRKINVTAAGGFALNGKRLNIKGVSLYHDNISVGTAFADADYDADLEVIRAMGANAVRSAAMPHAQYFYDYCDRDGLLVWVELPFQRAPFFGDVDYFATPRFEANGRLQLRELIAQNINHPSVVMWGIYSCLWSRGDDVTPYIRTLNNVAHTMDASRPTVACSNQDGELNFITDLIVWQQNVGLERGTTDDVKVWSELLRKRWSKLCSAVCYGAEGMPGHSSFEAQPSANVNWLPENRQTQFHEGYARHLDSDSLFWGVWINNMFDFGSARRPYGVNASGLVTLNRREVKDAYYLYKALWNKQVPTLHITDKRRRLRAGEAQQFTIYAQQQPTLSINGAPVAVREWAPCQYRSDTVKLSGRCMVEAKLGELTDRAEITVGNVLKQRPLPVPLRKANPQPTN